MAAKNGNALVKALLVLAVVAVAVFFALRTLRDAAIVSEVTRGPAVDAVPGSVEVLADKGLQPLKVELAGKVAWCAPLTPGTHFKQDEVLLKLDTSALDRAFAETKRALEDARAQAKIRSDYNSE